MNTMQFSSEFGVRHSRASNPRGRGSGATGSHEQWCSAPQGSGVWGAVQSVRGAAGDGMTAEEARWFLRKPAGPALQARWAGSGRVGGCDQCIPCFNHEVLPVSAG